jgi:hypothetical protein
MGLFTPKWKTNDRSKQIKAVEAVRKVTNEKELKRIALEAPLPDVRMIAVYQMKDPALLREMAISGDKYVSKQAVEKISNRDLLAEIVEKAASQEAKEQAGKQLDFLTLLYEAAESSGIDINRRVEHGTLRELIEGFDFTDDTHARKVVPAIISQMTDTEMIDKLVEACKLWRNSKDAVAESARLRKLEVQFDGLDKDEFLIFRINLLNLLATQTQKLLHRPFRHRPDTLDERIIRFLSERCVHPAGPKNLYILMARLAEEVGDSRLDVSRALNRLQRDGLVILHRGRIEVPRMERLLT